MKSINKQIPVLLVLFLAIMVGNTFANLVTNGGFENAETGLVGDAGIEGWQLLVAEAADPAPTFEIVDDDVKEGDKALKISVQSIGANPWDIQVVADSIPAIQGTTYSYSIWAKADKNGAQANFTVGNYDYSEYGVIRPATLTTEWKEFKITFTVSDSQSFIRAPIHLGLSASANTAIYIDNLYIADVKFGKTPVVVEAESGTLGSSFAIQEYTNISYIYPTVNNESLTSPGDTNRIASYQVTFEDSGYYNLFARLRVGSGNYNDDSFFPASGFGVKDDTLGADWVMANGLASAGFTNADNVVNGTGTAGSEVWKWVNLTQNYFPADSTKPSAFWVGPDTLTQIFQLGSREDGLDIDKIAFGKAQLYYTVNALDNGLPGSTELEPPDSSKFYQGPPYAQNSDKFLGNVKGYNDSNIFKNYWTQVTPGNEGKFASVGVKQDTNQWNWTGLDRIYDYAMENDLIFKNHCLIWGNQQPGWISELDSAEQYTYLETWIRQVGERYPDMDMIDVVNEPLRTHNPPDGQNGRANYKQALGGDGETGWDWVIKSFELARIYMPNAELILNDYGIINDDGATGTYIGIINLLKNRGLIDAIGVQGHRFEFESPSTATLKRNLDRLAVTGLPIYISEMDLGNIGDSGTPDDAKQLELYERVFPVIWEHPAVKGITLWGYLEGQMWQETCFLVREDGEARPALEWLTQYMQDYISDVEEPANARPAEFTLEQNYPNPFNPVTNIRFSISRTTDVSLKIYDILGQEVRTLVNGRVNAGAHNIAWDARNSNGVKVVSGVYFYKLKVDKQVLTQKMLLLK